jgi:hypothetical protein
MQPRSFAVAVFLLSIFALGNHTSVSATMQSIDRDQQAQERNFLARRENFKSGRELLLEKRIPFDPDELLRDGWIEKLKPTLDAMPEMRETRYETAPMKGAYMADTLYLPEKVQLIGHTLILANYVVFEGKKPVLKGNFDLHFFPTKPVVVLNTTLAEALHKKAHFLNAKFGRKAILPSFSLIQELGQTGTHEITFDVSGLPPEAERHARQKPGPRLHSASWNQVGPILLPLQTTDTCHTSCDKSPKSPGSTGSEGPSPPAAGTGNPNGGPAAPNGSCASNQSPNGFPGTEGGAGPKGPDAGDGGPGGTGMNAGNINVDIIDGDTNLYTFIANGGKGGKGGPGGIGARGGDGGAATAGGNGVACGCMLGNGGNGGKGGDAGQGGHGGNGGQGGNGGNGGTITGFYPLNGQKPNTSNTGGDPGDPGDAGSGGFPGNPGPGGAVGEPAKACGVTASPGTFLGGGAAASGGGPGNPGAFGQSFGQPGPTPNVTRRTTTTSGGGGITPNPCLNGATAAPGSGAFTTPGTTPTCSPIIVDTRGEGFPLTSAAAGVRFDITGTGQPIQLAWTERGSHDAFLTLPGPDGLVHNGKELFGNFTPQPPSEHPNGFLALAQFDKPENGGNGDGVIDNGDAVFSRLRLWIDENHDGVCQINELHTLPELGVFSLALKYRESRRTDDFGNQFRYKARVNPDPSEGESDVGRWTYDVFLTTTNK